MFLHPHYQPHVAVGAVDANLSDFAILAAALAGVADGLTRGWAPLRAGRAIWPPFAAFLILLLLSLTWARYEDHHYALGSHLVSALKFVEYAVLAPAAALVLRDRVDRRAFAWAVALWTSFLSLIAVLQFVGLVDEFNGKRPVQREPSYIGIHDFGALAGGALAMLFASVTLPPTRARERVAGIAGGVGVAIAAAFDAVGGIVVSAVAIWALARTRARVTLRQTVTLVSICVLVIAAAVFLRGSAIASFMRFLGVKPNNAATSEHVQTYAQRVLLSYIGVVIWIHHPIIGAGWQESHQPHSFEPVLPSAHRHFKSQPAQAFPAPDHEWGVQNGIVQTLADLGIVGLLLLAWAFFAAFRLLVRTLRRGPPELVREGLWVVGWITVGIAVFTGTGLLPGVTVDAQLWLGLGLAAALNHSLTSGG